MPRQFRRNNELGTAVPLMKPDLTETDTEPALHIEGPDEPILEPYLPGLLIAYALDRGDHFELVARKHCEAAHTAPEELRPLAISNLRRVLPAIERQGAGPAYMLVAGGNLESSLLLLDDLWEGQASAVSGRLVAAVPARDVLLFTGSASPEGISAIHSSIERLCASSPDHTLSNMLYQRSDSGWERFEERAV